MIIDYDCEFVEDGRTIDLVSIGMVTEDGRELYAVSSDVNEHRLLADPWLADNVWPHLPVRQRPPGARCRCTAGAHGTIDRDHPDVRPRAQIRRMVADLIRSTPEPELWAWYGAYDHVAYAQLFGRMIDLPPGFPMYTNDLRQEAHRLGNPPLPVRHAGEHNALADARHLAVIRAALREHEARMTTAGQRATLPPGRP